MYTAATVLIAAHIFKSILEVIPRSCLAASLEQAFDCLRHYGDRTKSARRCRSALEVLYKKIILPRDTVLAPGDPADRFPQSDTAQYDFAGITMPSDVEQGAGLSPLFEGMEMFWQDSMLVDQNYEPWL